MQVSRPAPNFVMASTKNMQTLDVPVHLSDYKGKWLVMFFYPLDFTFVCPTEILGFHNRIEEFKKIGAEVLGVSVDSVHSHKAWIQGKKEDGGLGGELAFPLASDITKSVSADYGVLLEEQGVALRGLFIIDPDGVLRYSVVNDLNVGRSVTETLRVLQAFQNGGLCPVDWNPGDNTL